MKDEYNLNIFFTMKCVLYIDFVMNASAVVFCEQEIQF